MQCMQQCTCGKVLPDSSLFTYPRDPVRLSGLCNNCAWAVVDLIEVRLRKRIITKMKSDMDAGNALGRMLSQKLSDPCASSSPNKRQTSSACSDLMGGKQTEWRKRFEANDKVNVSPPTAVLCAAGTKGDGDDFMDDDMNYSENEDSQGFRVDDDNDIVENNTPYSEEEDKLIMSLREQDPPLNCAEIGKLLDRSESSIKRRCKILFRRDKYQNDVDYIFLGDDDDDDDDDDARGRGRARPHKVRKRDNHDRFSKVEGEPIVSARNQEGPPSLVLGMKIGRSTTSVHQKHTLINGDSHKILSKGKGQPPDLPSDQNQYEMSSDVRVAAEWYAGEKIATMSRGRVLVHLQTLRIEPMRNGTHKQLIQQLLDYNSSISVIKRSRRTEETT